MESLYNLQEDVRARIGKLKTNYKKSPKDRLNSQYVQVRLDNLEHMWEEFITTHKRIYEEISLQLVINSLYVKNNVYDETEELYLDLKTDLKIALESFQTQKNSVVAQGTSNGSQSSQIKLPKIIIPTFSGKYQEWPTFRDLFTSLVHNNKTIDEVQKLHYLKGYLSGEAEQLLRNIPISCDNYNRCWELLQSRYNNKKYISSSILKRLLSQKNASAESSIFLKNLLDTSTDCLSGLVNLGIDVSSWDILLIHILSLKLDPESRKQWELSVPSITSSNELPTFKNFTEFLTNRYRALEFLDSGTSYSKTNNVTKGKSYHLSNNNNPMICEFCNEGHKLSFCEKFAKEDIDSKLKFVEQNGVCFNCLGSNHNARSCYSQNGCRVCKRRHHTLLHSKGGNLGSSGATNRIGSGAGGFGDSSSGNNSALSSNAVINGPSKNNVSETVAMAEIPADTDPLRTYFSSGQSPIHGQILLATALVRVEASNGKDHVIRALLDQGSQASFVTEATSQLLGLKKIPVRGIISGLEGNKNIICKYMVVLNLRSRINTELGVTVRAYVLKKITSFLPSKKVVELNELPVQEMVLADPQYHTPNKIDVLLGAEVYGQVIQEGVKKGPCGYPIAQKTTLGWILSGAINRYPSSTANNMVVMHTCLEDNEMLKRFWELECEPILKIHKMTEEEKKCEEYFEETVKRDHKGRYIVKLPFIKSEMKHKTEDSRAIAQKRLDSLQRRLHRNERLKKSYKEVIAEYLSLGHMERVPKENIVSEGVYLPHHAVTREDKDTTKVRVVFDASCKGRNGVSLNDTLMVGPRLQPELRHLLIRWRTYPICLSADIIKMYRQVKVDPQDADYQRILWSEDPASETQDYRMLRVTFGTACAPYLAVKVLQQVAKDEGVNYPVVAEMINKDYYMDDLLTGCQEVKEGLQIFKQMNELLEKGGFKLQKWTTNSIELMESIKREREGIEDLEEGRTLKLDEVIKLLGLTWNRTSDEFRYSVVLPEMKLPVTKRNILSDISKLFDPLGWVAPSLVVAKVYIQRLWILGMDWDEEVPERVRDEWITYRTGLADLTNMRIPRWLGTRNDDVIVELHGFADASKTAYAAVVYIRTIDKGGKVNVLLVTAKTKVAPIKQISIPKLELCGAVLLSKLLFEVSELLSIPKANIYAWTDSTVVLAWISSHPNRWQTFVANRVAEILTTLECHQWYHVRSQENPADCASRGCSALELVNNELWIHGPTFLHNTEIELNKPKIIDTDLEVIKTHFINKEDTLWTKFSSLTRLVRVVAYCRRFLNLRKPDCQVERNRFLTAKEICKSLETCIKKCQEENFGEELLILKEKGNSKLKGSFKSLTPYLDDNNILRVGGRLDNSRLSSDRKHPMLLPKRSILTDLIIRDAHFKTLHGGPQLMLTFLASKFWIFGVKQLVKACVRKCVRCSRYRAETCNQLMGQLPASRVTPGRPFIRSGVDYAGPINVRTTKGRGYQAYKGYICLFVCMATRAVHIEVVSDLTSQGFLAAFKRFVARRGHCLEIWSDNGTNFVGASKELRNLFKSERSGILKEIMEGLENNGTTWHFIPPHAPNFGGLWEAGVKSVKYHLRRVIGETTLTYEELTTVLVQIEACLNSRPLCAIDNDTDCFDALTPGHFLVGEPLITAPDHNYESDNVSTLRRWHLTQRMLQGFWRRWSQDYLKKFYHRYKWSYQTPEPVIGDIVLIKEDNLPPCRWLLGRVEIKHTSVDNLTRVVTLRTKNGQLKRPTSSLCILPLNV